MDGLRAVAILLVVAYHASVPQLRGGFIGVDVFFVVSGFLITRLLLRELERKGRVDCANFWARRVRRLLPLVTLTLVVTTLVAIRLLPPLQWRPVGLDALATAGYASNLRFASIHTDYFMAEAAPSPLVHTWSLAVEEQFYLVWPLIFVAIAALSRRRPERRKRAVMVALLLVSIPSFAAALWLAGSPWSFFGAPTRAWELGLGGGLALIDFSRLRVPRFVSPVAISLGLAAIVIGGVSIDPWKPYPGFSTLWPALGTAAVVVGGGISQASVPARVLGWKPLQLLGRWSYGWYLWHWPFLLFARHFPALRNPAGSFGAVGVALIVAIITYYSFENPIRFNKRLSNSNRATFSLGLGLSVTSVGAAAVAILAGHHALRDATLRATAAAQRDVSRGFPAYCVYPSLGKVESKCSFGAPGAPVTVALIGDSHARQWMPALDRIGRRRGFRSVYYGMGNCPAALVDIHLVDVRKQRLCAQFHSSLPRFLYELHPRAVVLSSASSYPRLGWIRRGGKKLTLAESAEEWRHGIQRLAAMLQARSIPFVYIYDIPRLPAPPRRCVQEKRSFEQCAVSYAQATAFIAPGRLAEEQALRAAGAATFDPVPLFCSHGVCPLSHHGIVAYADSNHMTATYARTLTRSLDPVIEAVLAKGSESASLRSNKNPKQ